MSSVDQGPVSSGLVTRVKNILLSPIAEWDRIAAEPATVQGLFLGYACILAAIGPVARLIGSQIFGYGFFVVRFRPSLVASLSQAVVGYVLGLVGVFVLAVIIDALAPNFGGTKDRIQAFKVAVYASTAAWVAAVFGLLPALSILTILGLYSLYLLYLGLPKLMKAPEDKAMAYTIVTIVVAVVVWVVVGVVTGAVVGAGMMGGLARNTAPSGVVNVGGAKVDLGQLEAVSKRAEQAAKDMQAAADGGQPAVQAVPAETLKGFMPASLPSGYARTSLTSESGSAGGLSGSSVEGVYSKGDAQITLTVSDVASAGALAALGGAFGVQTSRETDTGYEKTHMVDGRMVHEEWDKSSRSGKYGVMVANRFMVEAEGSGADMADLKAAVDAVGPDRLAGLAPKQG